METWQENAIVNIRRLISESGESQGKFAKNADIDAKHFSSIMTNARPITRQFVQRIADAYDRPTAWFYQTNEKTEPVTRTFADATQLLLAYQDSDQQTQGIALSLLTGDPKYISPSLPASVHRAVVALLESLKSIR